MSLEQKRHCRIEEIQGRHFIQTAEAAGLPGSRAVEALKEIVQAASAALNSVEKYLSSSFPKKIHASITRDVTARLKTIES